MQDLNIGEQVKDTEDSPNILTVVDKKMEGDVMVVSLKLQGDETIYLFRDYPTAWLKENNL